MARNLAREFESGTLSFDEWVNDDPGGLASYTAVRACVESGRPPKLFIIGSLGDRQEFARAMRERGIEWDGKMQLGVLDDHQRTFQSVSSQRLVRHGDPRINPYESPDGTRLFNGDWASLTTMPMRGKQVIGTLVDITPEMAAALGSRERDGLLKMLHNDALHNDAGKPVFVDSDQKPVVLTFVSQPQTLSKYTKQAKQKKAGQLASGGPEDMAVRIGYLRNSLSGLEKLPRIGVRAVSDVMDAAAMHLRACTADEEILSRLGAAQHSFASSSGGHEDAQQYKEQIFDLLKDSGAGVDAGLVKYSLDGTGDRTTYLAAESRLFDAEDIARAVRLRTDPEFLNEQAWTQPVQDYAHFTGRQLARELADPTRENSGALVALAMMADRGQTVGIGH